MLLRNRERTADVESAIGKLQRSVQALLDGDLILPADGGSLLAQLENTRRHMSAGNRSAAQAGTQRFMDLMQVLVQARRFDWRQSGPPIDEARTIIGLLHGTAR